MKTYQDYREERKKFEDLVKNAKEDYVKVLGMYSRVQSSIKAAKKSGNEEGVEQLEELLEEVNDACQRAQKLFMEAKSNMQSFDKSLGVAPLLPTPKVAEKAKVFTPSVPKISKEELTEVKKVEFTTKAPVTDEQWAKINEEVSASAKHAGSTVMASKNGILVLTKDSVHRIARTENDVSVSSTSTTPDAASMVRDYKTVALQSGIEHCVIKDSASVNATADLILELVKKPQSIKPIIENEKLIEELRNSKDGKCVEALKVYDTLHEPKEISRPKL
jgi:hypothetical protein